MAWPAEVSIIRHPGSNGGKSRGGRAAGSPASWACAYHSTWPGMHAVWQDQAARTQHAASLVRNGRWLVLLDADAAFLCNSIRPECEGSHSHRNGGLDSAVRQHLPSNRSEAQRPQRTHHSCRQSLLLRSLRSLQARAWRLNHADPSMLILSTFGFFAVRNDAWSRYLFDQFTAALESRPLCWLSTSRISLPFSAWSAGQRVSLRCVRA